MIRRSTRQFFRYALVGLLSNAVAYVAYLLIAAFDDGRSMKSVK